MREETKGMKEKKKPIHDARSIKPQAAWYFTCICGDYKRERWMRGEKKDKGKGNDGRERPGNKTANHPLASEAAGARHLIYPTSKDGRDGWDPESAEVCVCHRLISMSGVRKPGFTIGGERGGGRECRLGSRRIAEGPGPQP